MKLTAFVVAAAVSLIFCLPAMAADNSCIACHSNEDFYASYPKLYNYYRDWIDSPHSKSGMTCDDCHGGNPEAVTAERAHRGMFPQNDPKSLLHASRQPETCGACHAEKREEFEQSKHFRALRSETHAAPTCTTCHPAMNKRPSYHTIVLNACETCHKEGNRQGLPDVVDDAEDLLRRINVAHGMIGWARLHFDSHGWPEGSRATVESLEGRYSAIVDQVHRFDLDRSDAAASELLAELRALFEQQRAASPRSKP